MDLKKTIFRVSGEELKIAREEKKKLKSLNRRLKARERKRLEQASKTVNKYWRNLFLVNVFVITIVLLVGNFVLDTENSVDLVSTNNSTKKTLSNNALSERNELDKTTVLVENKDRKQIFQEWLRCAEEIVTITRDKEAIVILKFLQDNSLIVEPINYENKSATRFLEGANNPNWVAILSMIEADRMVSSEWKKQFDALLVGNFIPNQKTLIIREHHPISDIWKGIVLLHEARHAKEIIEQPYDWRDPKVYCIHERDTHIFQNRLLLKLGGDEYRQALLTEMEIIENAVIDSGKPFNDVVVRTSYNKYLDSTFGQSLSQMEINLRGTHLWMHAYFELFEKKSGSQANEMKLKFLFNLYKESGII